jgi:hypothetical protein
MARKERRIAVFNSKDLLAEEPCGLLSSARLARTLESRKMFLFAADMHENIYNTTGNEKALLKIESLAESALKSGKRSLAGAIYIKLFAMTYLEKYLKKAADCQESS